MVLSIGRPYNDAARRGRASAQSASREDRVTGACHRLRSPAFSPPAIRPWSWSSAIASMRDLSALVLALAQKLEALAARRRRRGGADLPLAHGALRSPAALPCRFAARRSRRCCDGLEAAEIAGRRWRIPACYDESLGLDLAEVAAAHRPQRRRRSSSATATTVQLVYMMGFLPGLPYLGGLPARVRAAAAREPAREGAARLGRGRHGHDGRLSAGEPGRVAHPRAARRPRCGTCGATPPALLAAGDRVTFAPVSLREYERLSAQAAAGELRLAPDAPQRASSAHDRRAAGAGARPHDARCRTWAGRAGSTWACRCPARWTT